MALTRRQRLLADISKELECGICLDRLSNPRSLACHHVYCLACLVELEAAGDVPRVLVCPECRHRTVLRWDQAPADLHCPVPLKKLEAVCASLEDFVRDVHSARSGACEFCPGEGEGERLGCKYCYQCHALLCEECAARHGTVATFQGHSVTDNYSHCPVHPAQVCNMHCVPCASFVCTLCAAGAQHQGHSLLSFTEGATKARAKLLQERKTAGIYKSALQRLTAVSREALVELHSQADRVQREINRAAKKAGKAGDRQANALTCQLRSLVLAQEEGVTEGLARAEGYLRRLEELSASCQDLATPDQDSMLVISGGIRAASSSSALYREILALAVEVELPGFVPEKGRTVGRLGVCVTRTYTPRVVEGVAQGPWVSSATQGNGPGPALAPRPLPLWPGVIPLAVSVLLLALIMRGLNHCVMYAWSVRWIMADVAPGTFLGVSGPSQIDLSVWVWLSVSLVCVSSLYTLTKLYLHFTHT